MRREREIWVAYDQLVRLFTGELRVSNLPGGARVIDIYDAPARNAICFIVEHPDFGEVQDFEEAPPHPAEFSLVHPRREEDAEVADQAPEAD